MSEVVTSIDIEAPPEAVWEVAMDPARLGEWVTIHRRLGPHSPGPPRRGYEMEQTLCLRGVNFNVHWQLVAADEPRHATWHGRGPARSRAETEYRLTAVGGGTRFDYRNEFKAPLGPLGAVASRALVGGLPAREAHATLRRLKGLVERDGSR
ncbi:MAG TPA: SRPBCC family protein [Solirubrobacteraceae bacterium]|nr:SRPBCC family protein [Solirubrobacteraceae bacterium]